MPKRDEELEYEYDEEAEGLDEEAYEDDDEESYADDEYEDDDEDSEYDEDEDEEDEGAGGGWMKKAAFALAGLLVLGGGAYAYLQGMLPFSPKPEVVQEVVQPAGGFANPNGLGKIAPTPGMPAVDQAVPKEPPAAEAPKEPAEAAPVAVAKDPAPTVETKVAVNQPAKVAPKPAAKPVKPVAAPPKAAPKPVVQAPVKVVAQAPQGAGVYAVQCGAFASAGNAQNLVSALGSRGFQAWISDGGNQSGAAFSIRTTVVNSMAKAEALKAKFASAGHPGAVVPAGRGRYVLQLGIFSQRDRAEALAGEMRSKGLFVSVSGGKARLRTSSKVLVGKYATMAQAQAAAAQVRKQGVPAIVVKL